VNELLSSPARHPEEFIAKVRKAAGVADHA